MWAGVCGGLGEYFGVDPTLVRLIFVVATIMTSGLMIVAYLALWLLEPEEPFGMSDRSFASAASSADDPDPFEPSTAEYASYGGAEAGHTSAHRSRPSPTPEQLERRHQWIGWCLVAFGALILMHNLNFLGWLNLHATWPAFLIAAGLLILFRRANRW